MVHVITRSAVHADQFSSLGLHPIVAEVTDPASLDELPKVDTVLYAIGYDRAAGPSMRDVYVNGLRNMLDALASQAPRFIYICSTSVYGQIDGSWVDEKSPCEPTRENGRICLDAEQVLVEHQLAPRSIRLRLAGIYGPGRIPRRETLRAGLPIDAPSDGFLNLIHVEDAVEIVLAADRCLTPPSRLYTVSDGHPVLRKEYYRELARLAGGPEPRFVVPPADSAAANRSQSDRRIKNTRVLEDLHVTLKYPTYREGLAEIVEGERSL